MSQISSTKKYLEPPKNTSMLVHRQGTSDQRDALFRTTVALIDNTPLLVVKCDEKGKSHRIMQTGGQKTRQIFVIDVTSAARLVGMSSVARQ